VKEIAEIRRALHKQDVELPRRQEPPDAASPPRISVGEAIDPLLVGPTAIAFGTDEARTAKAGPRCARPYSKVVRITGGVLGDESISADDVTRLAIAPAARGPAGQAGRRDAGAGRRRWPGCSARRCATSIDVARSSPTRRPSRQLIPSPDHPTPPPSTTGDYHMAVLTRTTCSKRSTR
jgi:hypothetical protein